MSFSINQTDFMIVSQNVIQQPPKVVLVIDVGHLRNSELRTGLFCILDLCAS
jgi:hypothetical protein